MKKVAIYSDGGCDPNPGPGGWAVILEYGRHRRELNGFALATTNNRMELQAAIEGLNALKEPCRVSLYTDSEYLKHGITLWMRAWKRSGWKAKSKKPVKNVDLWKQLDELAQKHHVAWHWVRGHSGHVQNERCDQLATAAIQTLRRTHSPEQLARALTDLECGVRNADRIEPGRHVRSSRGLPAVARRAQAGNEALS
ncbi:MAG TPA: ribonuclease HI [Verrucomicrobiae bacterium]|nr:ribonuclease HI [Verrucomicrobiae bacterium]